MNFDQVNRQSVSKNVVILGMPSLPNENLDDIILKTFKQIGANITPDSIISVSRDTAMKEFVLDKKKGNCSQQQLINLCELMEMGRGLQFVSCKFFLKTYSKKSVNLRTYSKLNMPVRVAMERF